MTKPWPQMQQWVSAFPFVALQSTCIKEPQESQDVPRPVADDNSIRGTKTCLLGCNGLGLSGQNQPSSLVGRSQARFDLPTRGIPKRNLEFRRRFRCHHLVEKRFERPADRDIRSDSAVSSMCWPFFFFCGPYGSQNK